MPDWFAASTRGAWIEIAAGCCKKVWLYSRTPHGVRGLKCALPRLLRDCLVSHPAWGAWIEINVLYHWWNYGTVAPRMGCVD